MIPKDEIKLEKTTKQILLLFIGVCVFSFISIVIMFYI